MINKFQKSKILQCQLIKIFRTHFLVEIQILLLKIGG